MANWNAREAAITTELDRAVHEHRGAKQEATNAQVRYHSAREALASIRRLATEMLSRKAMADWLDNHPDVRFMGMSIGDAILTILEKRANEAAWAHANSRHEADERNRQVYYPYMSVDEITAELESGGFEFRSITPRREVNAALLKLQGVKREGARYRKEDSAKILERVISIADDDVPF